MTLWEARQILGVEAEKYSDEQLQLHINLLKIIATLIINDASEKR